MSQVSNLGSTVLSGTSAGLIGTIIIPVVKAKYGFELTAEQAGAVVGILTCILHGIVMLPNQIITWRAAWNAAKPTAAIPQVLENSSAIAQEAHNA
jgi:hypothetical protein